MKGYKKFVFAFIAILILYFIAEWNRPKNFNWDVSLSKEDKNPYGAYILFNSLNDLFPSSKINTYRLPVYDQVNNFTKINTAYLLIDPVLNLSESDVDELLKYAREGNHVFMSSGHFDKALTDSLKFKTMRRFDLSNESTELSFKNPKLQSTDRYVFNKMSIDGYFSEFDTANTIVLGNSRKNDVNFIKVPYGKGVFYIHASPVCFSNYFIITAKNAGYAAKALSFLPKDVDHIFWDEYYKVGAAGSRNPLRFLLNDPYLMWGFRIAVIAMVIFVLFEMKRRQRVIPIIDPLKNSTLDFVGTVGTVYFNQRDNKNIAQKKISYFLEFVRSNFYLPTGHLNDEWKESLSRKSGVPETEVQELMELMSTVNTSYAIHDETLLLLNKKIDSFYESVK